MADRPNLRSSKRKADDIIDVGRDLKRTKDVYEGHGSYPRKARTPESENSFDTDTDTESARPASEVETQRKIATPTSRHNTPREGHSSVQEADHVEFDHQSITSGTSAVDADESKPSFDELEEKYNTAKAEISHLRTENAQLKAEQLDRQSLNELEEKCDKFVTEWNDPTSALTNARRVKMTLRHLQKEKDEANKGCLAMHASLVEAREKQRKAEEDAQVYMKNAQSLTHEVAKLEAKIAALQEGVHEPQKETNAAATTSAESHSIQSKREEIIQAAVGVSGSMPFQSSELSVPASTISQPQSLQQGVVEGGHCSNSGDQGGIVGITNKSPFVEQLFANAANRPASAISRPESNDADTAPTYQSTSYDYVLRTGPSNTHDTESHFGKPSVPLFPRKSEKALGKEPVSNHPAEIETAVRGQGEAPVQGNFEEEQTESEDDHDIPSQDKQNANGGIERPELLTINVNGPITINYHAATGDQQPHAHSSENASESEVHAQRNFNGGPEMPMVLDPSAQLLHNQEHTARGEEPIVYPHRRSGAFDDGNIGMDADGFCDSPGYHQEGAGCQAKPYPTDDVGMRDYSVVDEDGVATPDVLPSTLPALKADMVPSGARSMDVQSEDEYNAGLAITLDEIANEKKPRGLKNSNQHGNRGPHRRPSQRNSDERQIEVGTGNGKAPLARNSPIQTRSQTKGKGKGKSKGASNFGKWAQGISRPPPRKGNRDPVTRPGSGRVEKPYNKGKGPGKPKAQSSSSRKSKGWEGTSSSHRNMYLSDLTSDSADSASSSAMAPGKRKMPSAIRGGEALARQSRIFQNMEAHLSRAAQQPAPQNGQSAPAIPYIGDQREPRRSTMSGRVIDYEFEREKEKFRRLAAEEKKRAGKGAKPQHRH